MPAGEPIRVLIADDDTDASRLLEGHLTDAGYEVLTAANGVQAMQVLLTEGPPIVITEWMMPEMDGLALCQAIRSHEAIPFVYVIMVTARRGGEDNLLEAFSAGADDYLSKPFNPQELIARVRVGERIANLQVRLSSRSRELQRFNAQLDVANTRLMRANEALNRMATFDELTGLTNRREALVRLSDYWASAERHGNPLALIAIDIDHFKCCNDAYGHTVGDVILKETADVFRRSVRREETVCRIGGDEFLVLCPHASTEAMAAVGAERMRRAVEANVIQYGDLTLRVTISLGVAERTPHIKSPDDLLRAADDALYAAKDVGRNTVATACKRSVAANGSLYRVNGGLPPPAYPKQKTTDEPVNILVVDDDVSSRSLYKKFLEREGRLVREARDGAEALRKIEETPPDVIIMDAVMPGMSGLDCTQRLKANPATQHIPVILASARTDAIDIVTSLEAGAEEYLTKPVNPRELLLRVKTMVRLGRELARNNEVRKELFRSLGLLLEFSRDIVAADSVNEVLARTVHITAALVRARRVSIMLPDAHRRFLTVAKCVGIDADSVADVRVAVGTPTSGQVFKTRKPAIVSAINEATQYGNQPDAVLLAGVPSASMSLCGSEGVAGVLNVTGRQNGQPFTPVELKYLNLICNIAGSAIHERLTGRARDEARHSIVIALAKLAEHRDPDTGRHLERLNRFCSLLAEQLRSVPRYHRVITDQFLEDLQRAVPLHDIGKVAVPEHILLKPGSLNAEETAVMQAHAAIGAETIRSVIERIPGVTFLTMADEIAHAHHEWYNGKGYPRGLRAEAIPLAARIAAVADAYDAITTKHVYKEAKSHKEAVAIITKASGRQFDPDVVDAFVKIEGEFKRLAAELADDAASTATPPQIAFISS